MGYVARKLLSSCSVCFHLTKHRTGTHGLRLGNNYRDAYYQHSNDYTNNYSDTSISNHNYCSHYKNTINHSKFYDRKSDFNDHIPNDNNESINDWIHNNH